MHGGHGSLYLHLCLPTTLSIHVHLAVWLHSYQIASYLVSSNDKTIACFHFNLKKNAPVANCIRQCNTSLIVTV